MRRIYVCSPLRDNHQFTLAENLAFATHLCKVTTRAGYAAWASHAFYPSFLDDTNERDRLLGRAAGLAWLAVSDEVWVYADDIEQCSDGMKAEIEIAIKLAIPPKVVFMPPLWRDIQRGAEAAWTT